MTSAASSRRTIVFSARSCRLCASGERRTPRTRTASAIRSRWWRPSRTTRFIGTTLHSVISTAASCSTSSATRVARATPTWRACRTRGAPRSWTAGGHRCRARRRRPSMRRHSRPLSRNRLGQVLTRSTRTRYSLCYLSGLRKVSIMTLMDERQRRIVTTHAGSLPRPTSLSARLFARVSEQSFDADAFTTELRDAVRAIVAQQRELGIDVVSDGEFSKISFQYYVTDRLGGIAPIAPASGHRVTRETRAFPAFYRDGSHSGTQPTRFACTGPIRYTGHAQLAADLDNL